MNARRVMVVAPHLGAAETGAEVLRRGGNAIEALVAAGAALSVLYPHFCGLGGDAVWLIADETGVQCRLGIGQATATPVDRIDLRGPGSTLTSAGLVDSWDAVMQISAGWGGTDSLSTLLAPAIALAEDGFPVSRSQHFWFDFRQAEMADWPGFAQVFASDGIQRQPGLADSLRAIAEHGPREFYEGALARRIAQGLKDAGSPLTAADLAATATRAEAPIRLNYRGFDLYAPPPPTQGVTTLGIMGVLAGFDLSDHPPGSAGFLHLLVEAVKQAFLDRSQIADPRFAPVDPAAMLAPERLTAKSAAIDPARAMAWPAAMRPGDTSFLAATDAQGRSACVLQSIYYDWGSGVVAGDTGILWQNRGAAFSTDPASPNRIAPGKLPFYTLNPGIAMQDGRVRLIYGTQGADGQPQTLALLLALLIDHGLDPAEALSHPRFLLGRTFSDSGDTLKLEAGLPPETVSALRAMGHEVASIPALSALGGQAGIIRIDPAGRINGAHDPRSDGGAVAT